jgi:hypothetical protein
MIRLLQTAALAAIVGFAGIAPTTAPVMAQGFELELGEDGLRISPDGGRTYRRDERRGRRCDPDRALYKAERMGVRRARISDIGRRTVTVRGRTRDGDRVRLVFGQSRSCPLLDS